MKIVFFGTPDYVVPVVESLHKTFKRPNEGSPVVAVVTQPPKPSGRKKEMQYSPVDEWAHKKKVQIYFDADQLIKDRVEADVAVLAAYGAILKQDILDYFPKGIVNIHPSALPKFRGASPVQATLASGEEPSTVTFMKMDAKMDHGPVISSFKEDIKETDTLESLRDRLFERSAEVIQTLLPAYMHGKTKLKGQNHDEATYTTLIKKDHGFIPWEFIKLAMDGKENEENFPVQFVRNLSIESTPENLERFIRSITPWPGAWTLVKLNSKGVDENRRMKILSAHLEDGKLVLDEVQIEGKSVAKWNEVKNGVIK